MEYLFCLSYYLYALYIYKKEKDFLHPIFLFCLFWAFINSLVVLNFFDFYYPSDNVFILSFVGCSSFFASFILYNSDNFKKNFFTKNKEHFLRKKLLDILLIITIIYMLYRLCLTLNLIFDGKSLDYIRRLSLGYNNSLVANKVFYLYNSFINKTLIELVFPIIGCIELGKNRNYKYLLCSLFLMILNTACTGGRFSLYYFIIIFTYTVLIYYDNLKDFIKKNFKIIILILSFVIVLLIFFTILRSSTSFLTHFCTYFSGAFYNLSVRLENLNENFSHTYGASSFLGVFRTIFVFTDNLNILPYPEWFNYVVDISSVENFIKLSDTIKFNGYVTPIYSFYLDGGFIGVIIGFFSSGFISSIIYNKYKNNKDPLLFAWLLVIILGIFTSMVVFPFTRQNFVISIILFRVLFKKKA